MEENTRSLIPYFVHEGMMARQERTIKRLWIMCIILVVCLIGTNVGWLVYESQWETEETTTVEQEVDTGIGDANVVGIGDINGESKAESNQN